MIETLTDLLHRIYDVEAIIRWGGIAMLVAIVAIDPNAAALQARLEELEAALSAVLPPGMP